MEWTQDTCHAGTMNMLVFCCKHTSHDIYVFTAEQAVRKPGQWHSDTVLSVLMSSRQWLVDSCDKWLAEFCNHFVTTDSSLWTRCSIYNQCLDNVCIDTLGRHAGTVGVQTDWSLQTSIISGAVLPVGWEFRSCHCVHQFRITSRNGNQPFAFMNCHSLEYMELLLFALVA